MKSPCKHPGCPALLDRIGHCDNHTPEETIHRRNRDKEYDRGRRMNTPSLRAAAEFRSSYKWKKVQRLKQSMNPLCEDPYGQHERRGITETGRQVHHIIGLAQCAGDERAYSLDNLMSVCWKCHARLERDERNKDL
jgi:5-methylcytosine-specific restriction endonuclease McrA